jgi:EPS-associated MarR family transcriptional regulator
MSFFMSFFMSFLQIHMRDMALACLNILFLFFPIIMNKQDIRLDLLRRLESNPQFTQRQLSIEMDVSLGKVNYCMKKLTEKGLIKLSNFTSNQNKIGYAYLLTPSGIEEKSRLTFSFLKRKIVEYEILKKEIITLRLESEEIASENL